MRIHQNIQKIKEKIISACAKVNQDPSKIKLIAVSKKVDLNSIGLAIEAGQLDFGENYVQEALPKIEHFNDKNANWHFIGHLQRNKVKHIVGKFNTIQSVDNFALAQEIDKRSEKAVVKTNIFIQLNLAYEDTKFGLLKENLYPFLDQIKDLKNIKVLGLMTMPPYFDNPEQARPYFKDLKTILSKIKEKGYDFVGNELSMGMSNDFEVAIEEGATIVRVGTAIFGERT